LDFSVPGDADPGPPQASDYEDAQCFLNITAKPMGDGRVQLRLVPEIHHGQPRQRWVGDDGFFRMDSSRDVVELDQLAVQLTLMPGQTLVMGGGESSRTVGAMLFAGPGTVGLSARLLLLRLAQTQFNDLFAPAPGLPPIATPPS
jgi:hypothetical protein